MRHEGHQDVALSGEDRAPVHRERLGRRAGEHPQHRREPHGHIFAMRGLDGSGGDSTAVEGRPGHAATRSPWLSLSALAPSIGHIEVRRTCSIKTCTMQILLTGRKAVSLPKGLVLSLHWLSVTRADAVDS